MSLNRVHDLRASEEAKSRKPPRLIAKGDLPQTRSSKSTSTGIYGQQYGAGDKRYSKKGIFQGNNPACTFTNDHPAFTLVVANLTRTSKSAWFLVFINKKEPRNVHNVDKA